MIEQPPKISRRDLLRAIDLLNRMDVLDYVKEADTQYWYWSDIKYKPHPEDLSVEQMWTAVRVNRQLNKSFSWNGYNLSLCVTKNMQRMCHEFDMNFGGTWGSDSIIPNGAKEQYLVSSLMEEAISSSQIEGASTTRRVAKEMLRNGKAPRNKSEQMIFNNYNAIRFLVEHKGDVLSEDLILSIHAAMTKNTLDEHYVGRFRDNDDVVVANAITNEIVHTPPPYKEIDGFVKQLCDFANTNSQTEFIHPILKAVIIHFLVSYTHPFVDGNGRTARALFYWYMLKSGYWLTEYLSISNIIDKSKSQYERMFLYTESDGGDMGYFVNYHLKVLDLAFRSLKRYIERKTASQNVLGLLQSEHLNERQAVIVSWFKVNPRMNMTVKEIATRLGVTHPTVLSDMRVLVDKGFLEKIPINKKQSVFVAGEALKG